MGVLIIRTLPKRIKMKKYKVLDNVKEIIVENEKCCAMIPELVEDTLGDWHIIYTKTELEEIND